MYPTLFSNWVQDGDMFFPVVLYSAIILTLVACSVYISNKRVHERVGKLVVFPYAGQVLIFILSVGGLLLAGIFSRMFEIWSVTAMNIGFATIFFLSYCISKILAEMTLNISNIMKDFIKVAAVAIGLLLLIIVSISFDILRYERYVPRLEDIEGIQMLDAQALSRDSDRLSNTALSELLIKDIEIISEAVTFHQTIVDERLSLRRFHVNRVRRAPRRIFMYEGSHSFSLLYKLKMEM